MVVVIEATYTVYALVEISHAWLQLFVQPTWTTNVSITIHQDSYSKLHHHYKCYKNFHTTKRHSHLPRPLLPSPGAAAAIVARTLAPQSSHDSLEDINILI